MPDPHALVSVIGARWKPVLVGSVVFALGVWAGATWWSSSKDSGSGKQGKKPNIIVISMCSVSGRLLGLIGGSATPPGGELRFKQRFQNAMRGSFRFDNYVARHPWMNLTRYTLGSITPELLRKNGYDYYYSSAQSLILRVPQRLSKGRADDQGGEGHELLSYKDELDEARAKVALELSEPFFFMLHFKYMHYPFYDSVNPQFEQLLPTNRPERTERLRELLARKTVSDDEEIPLAVLFNKVRSADVDTYALLNRPEKFIAWKKSPNYRLDLEVIKMVYKVKWEAFNLDLQNFLLTFGVGKKLDNTIFVVDGDHGETFMQHGELGHARQLYDDSILAPLWIRFPPFRQFSALRPVSQQIDKETVVKLLKDLITGSVNESNFDSWLNRNEAKEVVSRSCSGLQYSIRTKEKWKLIANFETGERELFNLNVDPSEKENLASSRPELVEELIERIQLQREAVDAVVEQDSSPCNPEYERRFSKKDPRNAAAE